MEKVNIEGLEKVQAVLAEIRKIPNREIHRIAAGAVLSGTQLRFRQGQAPDGSTWQARRDGSAATLRSANRRLVRSLVPSHNDQWGKVGTNLIYAALHQFGSAGLPGGVVRPRNKKALAIPISKEAARVGSPRHFPRKLKMIWERGKSTGLLVEYAAGKGKKSKEKMVIHYVLTRQVQVPARPFLGVSDGDRQEIGERLVKYVAQQAAKRG